MKADTYVDDIAVHYAYIFTDKTGKKLGNIFAEHCGSGRDNNYIPRPISKSTVSASTSQVKDPAEEWEILK